MNAKDLVESVVNGTSAGEVISDIVEAKKKKPPLKGYPWPPKGANTPDEKEEQKWIKDSWKKYLGTEPKEFFVLDMEASFSDSDAGMDAQEAFIEALEKNKAVKRVKNPDGFDEFYKKPFLFHWSVSGGHSSWTFDMKDKPKVIAFYNKL